VAERVDDPAQAPAVLVGHRGRRDGAGPHRLRVQRVWIVDYQQGPAGRAADRLRAESRPGRAARGNPEGRVPDCQLRDDLIAFADPVPDRAPKAAS
jgi:hypothetical protein